MTVVRLGDNGVRIMLILIFNGYFIFNLSFNLFNLGEKIFRKDKRTEIFLTVISLVITL